MQELDLIVVGAGLTGAAIARDAALRGLRTLLVEERDLGAGASGQVPELLDAGPLGLPAARRRRLARELVTLRRTAGGLLQPRRLLWPVEAHGGLLPSARRAAGAVLRGRAADAPVWYTVDATTRRRLEPAVVEGAQALVSAGWTLPPQRLIALLVRDAEAHGALIHNGWRVTDLVREGARVIGVVALDLRTGRTQAWRSCAVINATGPDLSFLAHQLGHRLPLQKVPRIFARFDRRTCHCALELGDGVRLLPEPRACWVGPLPATSRSAGLLAPVTVDELRRLRRLIARWVPGLREAPVTGLRALVQARLGKAEDPHPAATRAPRIVDHADHGCPGMISVVGGTALEHRWVAQRVVDRAVARCDRQPACRTADESLPCGRGRSDEERWRQQYLLPADAIAGLVQRHGSEAHAVLELSDELDRGVALACRCQAVSVAELHHVAGHEHVGCLADLLRRTGAAQGGCLGARCLDRCAQVWRRVGGRAMTELQRELEEIRRQRDVELGGHLSPGQAGALQHEWREPEVLDGSDGGARAERRS